MNTGTNTNQESKQTENATPLIHIGLEHHVNMQSLLDLYLLVDKFAATLPELNLDGDEQEEYSTMLLWLQNQVEGGSSSGKMPSIFRTI